VVGARHQQPLDDAPRTLLGHGFLLQPTAMARRAWFETNPYDDLYVRAEDKELWARTWQPGRFARLPDPLLYYREASTLRPAAYRAGCRSDRRIIRRYGPRLMGRRATATALLRSYAVEGITVGAHRIGAERRLIRLRTAAIAVDRLTEAQRQLDDIRAQRP
jgi:hypothetical protein